MSDTITGKNAIFELLSENPDQIEKIVIKKGIKSTRIGEIIDLCKKRSVRFDFVPVMPSGENGGVIAYTTSFTYTRLSDLDMNIVSRVVILDNIEDPHNLGAIIRSAAGSGTHAVIIPDRNAAQVTETVIKVSAGTIYKINIVRVKNIVSAILTLKKESFWVTGTDMDGTQNYRDYDYTNKSAIVIGNESKGMRRLVKEKCDDIVRIDLANGVESLNASVAAALILFEAGKIID